MRLYLLLSFLVIASCSQTAKVKSDASAQTIAQTPPMGWNSWNSFGVTVKEEQVKANAEYMAENLKEYGWEYVVVDLGWYLPPTLNTATFKVENPPQHHDPHGRLLPDTLKFPSASKGKGFKPLADYVHSLGLKFGIHMMRGLPWQADAYSLSVLGTEVSGKAISNPSDTCVWYDGMLGINMIEKGAQEYYNSIVNLYASWGVDYIKADDMSYPYHAAEIAALHKAIENSGRPIVLSLSPGAAPLAQADHLKENANLWRISPDFCDLWAFLKKQFGLCRQWQLHIQPGHWPDADMLPLGKLRVTGPNDYIAEQMGLSMEEITNEYSRFTPDEKYTLMTLWSIFRSPLMMGGHMPENDPLTLKLLTNPEVLAVNQHSSNNKELKAADGLIVWTADAPDGGKYIALFNTNDQDNALLKVSWQELKLDAPTKVRDLWGQKKLEISAKGLAESIKPHSAKLFKVYSN